MSNTIQPHIRCGKKDVAKYAILPGDPDRVERVRSFLDNPQDISYNREFKSCMGYYKGVKILVVSTGIGGPSTAIAIEELKNIGVQTLIRIGSCGALQDNIRLGELVIANGAVRDDGTSESYVEKQYPAIPDTEVLLNLIKSAKELCYSYHCGKIRSHDGLYVENKKELDHYWGSKGILGSDMESAALFVIGGLRKLRIASVLNVVVEVNGKLDNDINNYVDGEGITALGEKREIMTVLEAIVKLDINE